MTENKRSAKEYIARGYLWLAAIVFVGLGISLLCWPTEILKRVEVKFDSPTAFADIRADYGGCIFGVGVFLVWCASHRHRVGNGLLCVGLVFSGYVIGRLLSLMIDGTPKRIIFILIAVEIVGAAMAFLLYPCSLERASAKQ